MRNSRANGTAATFTSSSTDTQTGRPLPVLSSAAQAAVVAGLAVDAAGFAPAGGGRAVERAHRLVQVLHDGQVGGGGVGGGALQGGRDHHILKPLRGGCSSCLAQLEGRK